MKNTIFLLLLCLSAHSAQAQPKIKFTYDAAGNRTMRELIPMLTGGGDEHSTGEEATESVLSAAQVKVWPNPVEYQLHIEVSPEAESQSGAAPLGAELYDANGRLLQQAPFMGNNGSLLMESLPAGTYFLFVRKGKQYLAWTVEKI